MDHRLRLLETAVDGSAYAPRSPVLVVHSSRDGNLLRHGVSGYTPDVCAADAFYLIGNRTRDIPGVTWDIATLPV